MAKSPKGTKATTATVTAVVTAANAFLATLSTAQQATVLQTFHSTNATKWSNFPSAGYNPSTATRRTTPQLEFASQSVRHLFVGSPCVDLTP